MRKRPILGTYSQRNAWHSATDYSADIISSIELNGPHCGVKSLSEVQTAGP